MKHLFKPQVIKWLWVLLAILFTIKVLWFVVSVWLLPESGINHAEKKGGKALYYRVKLSPNKAPAPIIKKKKTRIVGSIKDIKLLAIYDASDMTVVTVEYKRKTKVLSRGDVINDFMLEDAGHSYATFSKNEKMFKVPLLMNTKGSASIRSAKPSAQSTPVIKVKAEGEVVDAGDHKIIDKSLISHYAKNMDDIYKNIGIKEIKKGKKLEGFSISFIRKGSPFAKLGLKRGDTIKSINGQKIDNYNVAFGIFKEIENIENLTLVIQRGKEEMELEYEVN